MNLPRLPKIRTNSPIFIFSSILFLVVISANIFVPSSSWKKIFSLQFNNFAAVFSSTPNPDLYIISPGSVNAIAPDASGGAYIGGSFTTFGQNIGHGVTVETSTGLAVSPFPKVNNNVSVVIKDGNGGWFIGGEFTQVGTLTRNYIAHILSNGSVDTNFNPTVDNLVISLALSTTTNTLYIGGYFTTVNATTRNYIAAVDSTDGSLVSAFNPNSNFTVFALALSPDENIIYMAGQFSAMNGATTRRGLAAVNTSDGLLTSFDPNVGAGAFATSLDISPDGGVIYFGGSFSVINGVTARINIAAVSSSTGLATSFDPDPNGQVGPVTLSPDGNTLYFGGSFSSVNNNTTPVARNFIAAVDTTTGVATAFDPNTDNAVSTIIVSSDNNTVYFGGQFTTANGGTTRNYIAAASASNGTINSFDSNFDATVNSLAISPDDSTLYVGGNFTTLGTTTRNRIAHITSDGSVDPDFDPTITGGAVNALVFSSTTNTLYFGGTFTSVNSTGRNRIAAVNATNGDLISAFNPNADDEIKALALSSDGDTLYMGGYFMGLNSTFSTTRHRIAAVDTSTGLATSFDPDADGGVLALALSPDENTLYLGGIFGTAGGSSRNVIAAVSTSTGLATSFDPSPNDGVTSLVFDGDILFAGGAFTSFGGLPRNSLASYDTLQATTTDFNPNINNIVNAIAISGDTLYFGGNFTTVDGGATSRNRIAAADSITGISTSFDPSATGGAVNALALSSDGDTLFAGGAFTQIGGVDQPKFVTFPVVVSNTPTGRRARRTYVISVPPPQTQEIVTPSSGVATTSPSGATTTPQSATTTISLFLKNLRRGNISTEVHRLQQFLNAHGFRLAETGYGSPEEETNYFGPRTFNAVVRFQEANFDSILKPLNLIKGTGNFYEYSRARANQILSQ